MIAKVIDVHIRPGHADAFHESQEVWNRESLLTDGYSGEYVARISADRTLVVTFWESRETFDRAAAGLESLGFPNTGRVDRGFMDSLYFRDPNGLLIELATYTFQPPQGISRRDVFSLAHRLRVERGDYAIGQDHLDAAIEQLRRQDG